ncbi:isoleucine--tRNA ligase [Candidatus Gottesmanbacteria bacterium]|nr:isoleucine--tRNA ligase [Candidatus Gottesmanbacteria bacterium]
MSFKPVSPQVNFPALEEEILKYWKENKIFEKSVESRPEDKIWTFLDGPPFITGTPHYGSLLSSIPKDVFPRFWTMKGYRVRRVWGWDCHGLPAENKVETSLGLKSKREIEEKVGVKKFIEECKRYVSTTSSEWDWYIDHIGRWVDFKNAYKTMDLPYMETVMWVFKQIYDKGYIYKGLRVSLYCPHCATPISNFEVAMDADNYKEITEPANVYKYKLKNEQNTFILAWSTTPWNKIVTPALAVNPKLTYVKVKQGKEYYILAKDTQRMLKDEPYKILQEFPGASLVGKKFERHFDFYEIEKGKKGEVIIPGDFVTAEEGTGVVTIAAYGEEDLAVSLKENIQIVLQLDEEGYLKDFVPKWGGMYYLKADKYVNEDLAGRGLMYREDPYTHTVPTCWRCHTRLIYAPQDAWYVDIQKLKPLLFKTNKKINWFPKHFKYGRFQKSMEFAPDWNISRSRYWGSPVPVWECSPPSGGCGERFVPGSIKELEEAAGQKINDLHKPEIDDIKITCQKCGKKVSRVPEVLDSWIEAGSASFAERHFPFEKKIKLEDFFPPDFIAEYTGQIRAWFYVLHVIGAALYRSPAFKNVLVEGVILGTDGRKMSKNYGNYPDPRQLLQEYGGDALRLYLLGSPVMKGEDIRISEEDYRNQLRGLMLILWNVYNFFITYANVDKWKPPAHYKLQTTNYKLAILDRWILSRLQKLIENLTQKYENFNTIDAVTNLDLFIQELSTWYIRRSRDRVGPTVGNQSDKNAFYSTSYYILTTLCQLAAPLIPFLTDSMYRNLTDSESVHLSSFPAIDKKYIYQKLEEEMTLALKIVEKAHAQRKEAKIKVRQPLLSLFTVTAEPLSNEVLQIISKEINVKEIKNKKGETLSVRLDKTITPELKKEGEARELVRQIQLRRKEIGCKIDQKVIVTLPSWPKEFEEYIKNEVLAQKLEKGNQLEVKF